MKNGKNPFSFRFRQALFWRCHNFDVLLLQWNTWVYKLGITMIFFVHNYSLGVREHLLLFFKNTIFKDFILQMNFHITFCFFNIINKPCHNLRSLIIIYNCIIIIVIILVDNLSYNGEFQYVVVFFLQF